MPGLINAHTHIYSALARGLSIKGNNPTNFYEVLDGTWWNIDRHLDLGATRASAYATVLDCIKQGVTTIFDHHAEDCAANVDYNPYEGFLTSGGISQVYLRGALAANGGAVVAGANGIYLARGKNSLE